MTKGPIIKKIYHGSRSFFNEPVLKVPISFNIEERKVIAQIWKRYKKGKNYESSYGAEVYVRFGIFVDFCFKSLFPHEELILLFMTDNFLCWKTL